MNQDNFKVKDKVIWYGNILTPKDGTNLNTIRAKFSEIKKDPNFSNPKLVGKLMKNFRKEVYDSKYKVGVSTIVTIEKNYLDFSELTRMILENGNDIIFSDDVMCGVKIKPYVKRIKIKKNETI